MKLFAHARSNFTAAQISHTRRALPERAIGKGLWQAFVSWQHNRTDRCKCVNKWQQAIFSYYPQQSSCQKIFLKIQFQRDSNPGLGFGFVFVVAPPTSRLESRLEVGGILQPRFQWRRNDNRAYLGFIFIPSRTERLQQDFSKSPTSGSFETLLVVRIKMQHSVYKGITPVAKVGAVTSLRSSCASPSVSLWTGFIMELKSSRHNIHQLWIPKQIIKLTGRFTSLDFLIGDEPDVLSSSPSLS